MVKPALMIDLVGKTVTAVFYVPPASITNTCMDDARIVQFL